MKADSRASSMPRAMAPSATARVPRLLALIDGSCAQLGELWDFGTGGACRPGNGIDHRSRDGGEGRRTVTVDDG